MTTLAPILEPFFTKRLLAERRASPETVASYRTTFCLLLRFAADRLGRSPSDLDISDLDAPLIGAFLEHLEVDRHNSARTRNVRLAAIHSLFAYAALRAPEHAAVIQRVLAMAGPRATRAQVTFLTDVEVDALLASPDLTTWTGRRDHALLAVAIQAGLRLSELTGLKRGDVHLGTGAHIQCWGKGRKQRVTPLTTTTTAVLVDWLDEHVGPVDEPLFTSRRGGPLSADAVQHLVAKHAAASTCPSLQAKRVTPPHASPHRGDAPAPRRGRHLGHRPLARPRTSRDHADLPGLSEIASDGRVEYGTPTVGGLKHPSLSLRAGASGVST